MLARLVVEVVGVVCLLVSGACEYNLTGPTVTNTGTNTGTNTNTPDNTNNNDRSDTVPRASPDRPTDPGPSVPLPLPTYGETVTRSVAAANPTLLANSCQDTHGESAWQFLDLVIRTLRAQDQRWGYLCKDASCVTFGADIVAYRATSSTTGIWIVDVIQNHCPGPGDTVSARWGVLPFETERRWAFPRGAGPYP